MTVSVLPPMFPPSILSIVGRRQAVIFVHRRLCVVHIRPVCRLLRLSLHLVDRSLLSLPDAEHLSASVHNRADRDKARISPPVSQRKVSDLVSCISYYHVVETMGVAGGVEAIIVLCLQLIYDTLFYFVYSKNSPFFVDYF